MSSKGGASQYKIIALLSLLLLGYQCAGTNHATNSVADTGISARNIPPRSVQALTGTQFSEYISKMEPQQREQAIRDEIFNGNIPVFLRHLVPVELSYSLPSGKLLRATIYVTPDYLAIGSDADFLRVPMNLYTAESVALRFGFILPTKKMVDAIYSQSVYHLRPQPMTAGPQMRSTEYYCAHNQMIEEQARALGVALGRLVSGDKKDVVISNRLANHEGRIAIYGWHRQAGDPIQPLSTVHGAFYADYSHGIRLVNELVSIDGHLLSIYDVLRDPELSKVLSDEGPIRMPWGFTTESLSSLTFAPESIPHR